MGRPKQHDERTAAALLGAAERIAEQDGLRALSVRRVASEVGTTTRAVYSLFGSKDGLVVALGARAFDLLGDAVAALPRTAEPAADLVEAGLVFRRFALEHPALFRVGVQRIDVPAGSGQGFAGAAWRALAALHGRVRRVGEAGGLGHRSVETAAWEFHALCEGLAALEARRLVNGEGTEDVWRDALSSLITGWEHESPGHAEKTISTQGPMSIPAP